MHGAYHLTQWLHYLGTMVKAKARSAINCYDLCNVSTDARPKQALDRATGTGRQALMQGQKQAASLCHVPFSVPN